MIKKGLKVGDTFVDGKKKYKILKVNTDGTYISTSNLKDEEVTATDNSQSEELKEANAKAKNLENENQQIKDAMQEALDRIAFLESEIQKSREVFPSAEDSPPVVSEPPHGDGADSSTDNADIVIVPKEE